MPLLLMLLSMPALAVTPGPASPPTLCETAITSAEFAARLPPRLLIAIAQEETGRPDPDSNAIRPWPWTINAEGNGQYFATKPEAIAAVRALLARGVRSIDVGCMQINLAYHPDAFASLEEAFDPGRNAVYVAGFLNTLYAGSHDWALAIGAYHSETPVLGDAYRALVMARWQRPALNPVPRPVLNSLAVAYRAFPDPQRVYSAFARIERIYGAFAPMEQIYGAFAPMEQVYGAFATTPYGTVATPSRR